MNNNQTAIALYKALHQKRAYTKIYWDIANVIGIHEALLIEIIERWCELNQERGSARYCQDGEWWTSATYQEWAERYPALGSWRSIQRKFLDLEKRGYILSGQFEKGNQTKYYRVDPMSIGNLLLSGTQKSRTGIVPNSDSTVPNSDSTVPNSDSTVPNSDSTVPNSDHPPYIDQINRSDQINTPLTPQGGADREGREFLELRNSLTLVDNSESFSKTDNPDPETPQFRRPPFENENHSQRQQQAACDNSDRATQTSQVEKRKRDNSDRTVPAEIPMPDNSQFIGHGNVAPDGATRRFNQGSGKWMSKSSDPWMNSQNPLPEFKDWVYRRAIASGKQYSLANAAGEIRNNYERAGDLWEEYQSELAATAKIESQRRAAEVRRTPEIKPEPPFEPSQEWLDLGAKLKQISANNHASGKW